VQESLFEKRTLAEIPCKLCHPKVHNNELLLYEFLNFRSGAVDLSVILKYCVTTLAVVPQTTREEEQYPRITKISTGPLSVV
jgi:hypothetical protein